MKFKKILAIAAISLSSVTLLTACSSKATLPSQQQQAQNSKSSETKAVQIDFYHGNIVQSEGLLTVPVILNNTGSNDTVISSQNFTLKIAGRKFEPFQIDGEPADYHQELKSSNGWQNTISFYLGTTLTKAQLKKATLVYKDDNGSEVEAKFIKSSEAQSLMTTSTSSTNYTSLGDYYSKVMGYVKTAKDNIKQGVDVPTLKDQFQDDKYDRFRMWVVASEKFNNNIIIKAINKTNTDIKIPFSDLELSDKDENEIQVAPSLRDYSVLLPHGKAVTIAVPLESKIKESDAPYTVLVRSSTNSSFTSTKSSFNPIEFALNDSSDLSDAFGINPADYPKESITWKNPKITKNTLTVDIKLYDYFFLDAKASDYTIVGLNKNGSVGDKATAQKVTPQKVTGTGEKITLEFDDLSVIRTYKNIELRYKNTKLLKIR